MIQTVHRPLPATVLGASIVLLVKAALGLWGAFALMTASRSHHRMFLGSDVTTRHTALGSALLVLAVLSVVVAVALLGRAPWARVSAFGLEAIGAALALSRIASHTGSSVVSLALSCVIVGLLLAPSSAAQFARHRPSSAGA